MHRIPIVFAFDAHMEIPAGVCLSSLLENAAPTSFYDIFILHGTDCDFSVSKLNELPKFYRNCKLTFRKVEDVFAEGHVERGITVASYYRLLIPEIIPEFDKILYSDVDVIFREDLAKYYAISLRDCYFGSVNSVPVMNDDYLSYIKSRGMEPDNGYFYSGNLIINSKKIREDNKTQEFRGHRDKKYRFQDMDIINLTCSGNIKPLPLAFCLTVDYYEAIMQERERLRQFFSDEEMDYAIQYGTVHYNGAKPWKTVCPNMDIWWDYYRRSIFYDEQFAHDFWYNQTYRIEKMSLWKRIKQVARYFREGGRM